MNIELSGAVNLEYIIISRQVFFYIGRDVGRAVILARIKTGFKNFAIFIRGVTNKTGLFKFRIKPGQRCIV